MLVFLQLLMLVLYVDLVLILILAVLLVLVLSSLLSDTSKDPTVMLLVPGCGRVINFFPLECRLPVRCGQH